ncbi:hypothetical protein Y032_0024g1094 [Ancylostoma ceylanicum]|uniref:RRM domain-containing protein n=1 Tax=Ancylostoma ceylanicum TaxID=53326 RepID=A0A016UVL6_9BILA|nr:hypothetical protein Y032_0024g1094 [Ancylostoma ceylanicum]
MKVKKHHKAVGNSAPSLDGVVPDLPETEVTTPKTKKKKKGKSVEESSPMILEDANLAQSKKKKRANKSVQDGPISEEIPKKKKKRSSVEPSQTTITQQPEGDYVVGSLSKLFGGSPSTSTQANGSICVLFPPWLPAMIALTFKCTDFPESTPIFKGETVIKPKKQKKEQAQEPINDEIESQDEPKQEKAKDRVQQRENRKRAHEQRMTLEEKKRTLFVGNAPISMDERECKKLFSQYGPIESVRMRSVMPTKETITKRIAHISHNFHDKQKSLNFYVKFKDEESVQKALAYNGTILDRHRIRVDTCTSKAEYDRKLTVFVGNLPLDANEDELADLFEENVGGVSFVRCVKDQTTGMGKGFAFVVFKSASSVPLALSMTGLQFQKRDLRITKVMKKAKIAKVQLAKKKSGKSNQNGPTLTKEQSAKIEKFKFSTRKTNEGKRPGLKKKARKAIQRKKQGKHSKSLMH